MKKLSKDTKIKVLVLLTSLLFSFSLWAKPIVVVNSVVGNAFYIYKGTTNILRAGDHVQDLSEIVTEEGSQVTFADYHDHKFHLAGSGHVKLTGNITELLSGYVWVQSYSSSIESFIIQTANSIINYTGGEAIISYDKLKGRTQLYSLNDTFEIAHILEKSFKEVVDKGEFTFIDNDFENGAPRRPTELGHASYNKIRSLFTRIHPLEQKHPLLSKNEEILPHRKSITRVPASAPATTQLKAKPANKKGKIIYLWPDPKKEKAFQDKLLTDYYQKKIAKWSTPPKKKKFKPSYKKISGVTIKVYGSNSKAKKVAYEDMKDTKKELGTLKKSKKKAYRLPASVEPQVKRSTSGFEGSLMQEFKKQMRHSNEVNSLIRDLKNYNQDYQREY